MFPFSFGPDFPPKLFLVWLQSCSKFPTPSCNHVEVSDWVTQSVSTFIRMGYNDKSPNWVHEGEYSLRWPVVLWGSRQLSKELLPRRVLEGPSFHHRTPVKQTVLKSLGVIKSKTQGRLQLKEKKKTQEIRLKELFEDLLPVPWYAENTLYEFVTFNDWSKIQKQARISQVLQTTEPIKSW